ncbi:aminotransferase class IV [Legionella lansingensis]|nr:aminotransferase class IV [Legionella lansingensis]
MTMLIFMNKNGLAPFPLEDRIFLGEGLFETLRVANGKPCYPKLHWQRLQNSASFLDIPFDLSFDTWLRKLLQCIKINAMQNGGIKVLLSSGSAPRGLLQKSKEARLVFDAFNYVKNPRPLKLISAPWLRDGNNPIYQIKSINYLEAIMARRQAEHAEADDVLFFNLRQHATETSVANLFMIKDNQLYTPGLKSGILAGIIRQRLLALCKSNGIAHCEGELDRATLIKSDAIFITNTLQGIRLVATLDDVSFVTNHPLITLLQDLLSKDS